MKLLRHGIPFLFCALNLSGIAAQAQQPDQTAPAAAASLPAQPAATPSFPPLQVNEAQRTAVRRMLQAFHADELALQGMKIGLNQARQRDPGMEVYLAEIFSQITPRQMVEKMVPAYARYYSREEADAVTQFLVTPVGVKFVNGMVKDLMAGRPFNIVGLNLTPPEITLLGAFFQTPTAQKISKVQPMINQEVAVVMRAWGVELMKASMRKSLAPLTSQIDQDLVSQGAAPGGAHPNASPATAGQSKMWAAVVDNGVATNKSAAEARQRYQNDVLTLGAKMSLSAAGMTSADSIATSKQSVQLMGESLDRYLQSYDAIMKQAREKMLATDLPAGLKTSLMQGFDIGMSRSYDERIRYGENQRALLSLYQRLFDFAEARLGKISNVDGKLIFADAADQEIYRTITGQIVAEGDREAALVKESQDRVRNVSNNLR